MNWYRAVQLASGWGLHLPSSSPCPHCAPTALQALCYVALPSHPCTSTLMPCEVHRSHEPSDHGLSGMGAGSTSWRGGSASPWSAAAVVVAGGVKPDCVPRDRSWTVLNLVYMLKLTCVPFYIEISVVWQMVSAICMVYILIHLASYVAYTSLFWNCFVNILSSYLKRNVRDRMKHIHES